MKFIAFDLETTGVDVETAEVVQAAAVEAQLCTFDGSDVSDEDAKRAPFLARTRAGRLVYGDATTQLFYVASIPEGATAVHGIRAEDVVDKPKFSACVQSFVRNLTAPDVVLVSFNGCLYDIPIIACYMAGKDLPYQGIGLEGHNAPTLAQRAAVQADIEHDLRKRHIDVMRLWWRVQRSDAMPPWTDFVIHEHTSERMPSLTANMFAGSLIAAHGFFKGEGFADAHDAGADCRATLAVLYEILQTGFTVEEAIKASNEPLPGDVDFAGKFKWQSDRIVITIGKQAGTPIEQVDRGFLQWMLAKDFAADTKAIVREYLTSGRLPQRSKP